MDKYASSWEARLRPLFRVILSLTNSTRKGKCNITNHVTVSPPVVQSILLPLLESLESLVAHDPVQTLGISASSTRSVFRDTGTTGNHSSIEHTKTQLGAKGETHPSVSTDLPTLLTSRGIPPVNFCDWLNERSHATFSAWNDRLINRSRSYTDVTPIVENCNQNNLLSAQRTEFTDARQMALVHRFASRWRALTSELRWARKWGVTLNQPVNAHHSPNDPIPAYTWLATILFDPPDLTARAVCVCMDLLKSLSTYPNRLRKPTKSPTVPSTANSINKSRHSSLFNLCHKRRRLVLRFLTQVCLPRLDELAPARGSAVAAGSSELTRSLPMNSHLLNAGNAFVLKFHQLAGHSNSSTSSRSSVEPIDSGHAPFVPYLLTKVNFLDHVARLVDRLLSQIQRIESTTLRHWNELVAATMGSVSGTGALNGSTPTYTVALVAELLRILEPLKHLGRKHQSNLLRILLHVCVRFRQIVLQRSTCTTQAEETFSAMLDQLTGLSGSQIRDFLLTTLNVLAQYPSHDHQSALYLWKRMCAPVCPFDTDQAVFKISLEVWRGHEDYLLPRSRVELVTSDTRGFGPLIHDVIDYICTGNNLTTDMRLEIVCDNQILMPQLRLQDVYAQIWCANPNNTSKPMRLLYRIPGLEADNLPYVEQLETREVPPEQYSHLSVLASHPHGLVGLLNRLGTIQDVVQTQNMMNVVFHILKFCLKIDECRSKLIDPELRAIPVLLHALVLCLQVDHPRQPSTADGRSDTISNLIKVLEPILQLTDAALSDNPNATLETGDLNSIHQLLSCISDHPEIPVIRSEVARLLGLLTFGDTEKMDAIVQFLKVHLVQLIPSAVLSDEKESALLECCCALMITIRRDSPNGSSLRRKIVHETNTLDVCLHFLWNTIPACVLDLEEGTTLNLSDPGIASFLELPMLPHVLQMMRASVDGSQLAETLSQPATYEVPGHPDKPRVTARSLLHFLHLLETSKSSGRVSLLAEDMLDEWVPKHTDSTDRTRSTPSSESLTSQDLGPTVSDIIVRLRESTAKRTRRLARAMRQKQLRSMNMRVDEKGQIVVMGSDRLAEMTATVSEENGLTCAICHEGFRNAPQEAMGIYVYVRQCPLEESMVYGSESPQIPPVSIAQGYSTLSSFVTVHFSCHIHSLRSSSEDRWTVAQRHNRDARCNAILPILSPPSTDKAKKDQTQAPEAVYGMHLATFTRTLNMNPDYTNALHDVKILMCRFACNRQFHQETGGGGRESNMQLLPHLMQVCLHSMLVSSSVSTELMALDDFMDAPETQWATSEHCWSTTGPLYRAVAALHLWSGDMWRQQRGAVLRRLIYLGCGRTRYGINTQRQTDTADPVETVFLQFKAYFVFFGLIDAVYNHLFKDVPLTSDNSQPGSWCTALSSYISMSDEAILTATPKLLAFFQNDLLPIVSVAEFADVTGLFGELDVDELIATMNGN